MAWESLRESFPPSQSSAALIAALPLLLTVIIHCEDLPTRAVSTALVALVRACEQASRAVTVRVLSRPHAEKHKPLLTELQGAAQRFVTVTECEE
jgi:hypothetical protein